MTSRKCKKFPFATSHAKVKPTGLFIGRIHIKFLVLDSHLLTLAYFVFFTYCPILVKVMAGQKIGQTYAKKTGVIISNARHP